MSFENITYYVRWVTDYYISDIRIFNSIDRLSICRFSANYVIYPFPSLFHVSQVSIKKREVILLLAHAR